MAFSHDEMLKVARLARLDLAPEEVETFAAQLRNIVQYIEQLDELDTDDVEPMAHGAGVTNVFREDRVQPSLDRESALANAPKRDDECFRVPPVL
jgi:aspartyl-tRNA(Asn)/glutamyl-tRNA(Gln) amidotransferase subunit C